MKFIYVMKKRQNVILSIGIMLTVSVGFTTASAEILDPRIVHAIVSSPVSVFGKTYSLYVDSKAYAIYYGFKFTYANATNILLDQDHNSMQIYLKWVTETDAMWIQFPQNLLSAENNNFVLYVDGQERKYELATSAHSIIMGFTVPANATIIKIQGTYIVPEFPVFAMVVMAIGFMTIIFGSRISKSYC